jgi:hypothetical protein
MPEHTCQRAPHPDIHFLEIVREGDPRACGKVAHFTYKWSDFKECVGWDDTNNPPAWLCAECYDFVADVYHRSFN